MRTKTLNVSSALLCFFFLICQHLPRHAQAQVPSTERYTCSAASKVFFYFKTPGHPTTEQPELHHSPFLHSTTMDEVRKSIFVVPIRDAIVDPSHGNAVVNVSAATSENTVV
ncbi:hypothetical protein ACFX13_030359 [Malus domestica]